MYEVENGEEEITPLCSKKEVDGSGRQKRKKGYKGIITKEEGENAKVNLKISKVEKEKDFAGSITNFSRTN